MGAVLCRHLGVELGEGGMAAEAKEDEASGDADAVSLDELPLARHVGLADGLVEREAGGLGSERVTGERRRERVDDKEGRDRDEADGGKVREEARAYEQQRQHEARPARDTRHRRRHAFDHRLWQVQDVRPVDCMQHDITDGASVALEHGEHLHRRAAALTEELLGQLVVRPHEPLAKQLLGVSQLALVDRIERPDELFRGEGRDDGGEQHEQEAKPTCLAHRVW